MRRTLFVYGLMLALLLLIVPAAPAQSIYATLSGTVRDNTGAVVPGADITVTNANSGDIRKTVTNNTGFFSVTPLPTGTYNVTAVAKGFGSWQAKGIVLNSNDSRTMNIDLQLATVSQTVEVTGLASEVAIVDSGDKSALITSKNLQDLSLVGRNATEYLKLLPGATMQANNAVNRPASDGQVVGINGFAIGSNAGGLDSIRINGQQVDITMDGQHSFDPGAAGAATPVNANPNMISEVKVLTSNFTAENAKGPVVVNTVTKSGGSDFHGEAYLYARNSAMNAEDAFNKGTERAQNMTPGFLKVPSNYYYPGGNIGGPLIIPGTNFNKSRKKVFFFDGFEYYKQNLDGGVDRAFVPTDAMLNGDFSTLNGTSATTRMPTAPATGTRVGYDYRVTHNGGSACVVGGVIAAGCIDPQAQLLLRNYLPTPNTSGTYNYVQAFSVAQNSWQNVARGDWAISDNTKAFVTWSRQRETANMPMGLWIQSGDNVVPAPSNALGQNGSDAVGVSFLHVFSPTMTSETRFGYTKVNFPTALQNPAKQLRKDLGYTSTGIYGPSNTPAVLSWQSSFPNLGDVGHYYHPTMIAVKGIPSVSENLTKVMGAHSTKYGFYFEHTYNKQDNWGQYMGVFSYGATTWGGCCNTTGNEYADALMGIGHAGYFEQAVPPPTNLAQNIAAFYAQDDWKLTRRITVQYGMRFEHYAKPYSAPFGLAVFNPSKYDASIPGDQNTQTGISWHSLDHSIPMSGAKSRFLFFSPRIGAAIDIFGNGKTVIRGGWGKYRAYDSVQSNSYVQPAQTATGSAGWSCGWNDGACPTWESVDAHATAQPTYGTGLPVGNYKSVFVMDPRNDEQPLVTSYSLNIDQELPAHFKMEVSYVGNHGDFLQSYTNSFNGIPFGAIVPAQAFAQYPADCGSASNDQLGSNACRAHYRTYKDYTTINTSITAGKTQFDSLQASLNRSFGLFTLQGNYTFSKALGDGVQLANGGFPGALSVTQAEHWLWGVMPNNRAHALSVSYVIRMPKINGSKFLQGAVGGWELSGITQVQSGAQLFVQSGSGGLNFNLQQGGSNANVTHMYGSPDFGVLYPTLNCNPAKGITGNNQYANPSCFGPAVAGVLGNASMPYLPGPKFWNSDLTLIKNFKLTERQGLQFRFAAFNFLNNRLQSFSTNDNNLKLNLDDNGYVITGTDCHTNHADNPGGAACNKPSTFGVAAYRVGRRLVEMGIKYSF